MSAYEVSGTRRGGSGRTALAVFLAVLLLAVLGSVAGYLVGHNRRDTAGGGGGNDPSSPPAGEKCPQFMQDAAQKKGAALPLTLRLYIATDGPSEVWICAGTNGRLWYQGHAVKQGRYPSEVPVEGSNGLLLGGVNAIDLGRYTATNQDANGRTTYTVSKTALVIAQGGKTKTEKVVVSRP
jgi:hypothetical protein